LGRAQRTVVKAGRNRQREGGENGRDDKEKALSRSEGRTSHEKQEPVGVGVYRPEKLGEDADASKEEKRPSLIC